MKILSKITKCIPFIFLLFIINMVHAADENLINKIDQVYKSFDYDQVIILCQKALQDSSMTNSETQIDIYKYMGLSYYALGEMGPSYNKFYLLLTLNPQYQLDPARTPPKVLRFFNEIKTNFGVHPAGNVVIKSDTVFLSAGPDKASLIYSFILPGSGHLHEEFRTKGWILTSAALVTLSSSIYLIVETNNREKEYLNAIEKDIIEQKYQEYNDTYRLRNLSLGLFAGVWLYSQIDLLFISSYEHDSKSGLQLQAIMKNTYTPSLLISYLF